MTQSLRFRTLLIVGITTLALVIGLYVPLQNLILASFVRLEEQSVHQNIAQSLNAMGSDIAALNGTARDYAGWDDTYAFVEDHNEDFITTNFLAETFSNNRLSLIAIADITGTLVYTQGFDLQTGEMTDAPARFRSALAAGDPLRVADPSVTTGITGVLMLPDGPMLVAAQPILTSNYTGPARGTLIMGRRLDDAEVTHLAETTQLKLLLRPIDDAGLSPEERAAAGTFSPGNPLLVRPRDEQVVDGFALIDDVYGKSVLLLHVEVPRVIYQQGRSATLTSLALLAVTVIVLAALLLFLLDRFVLARVFRLSRAVTDIGDSGSFSRRVPVAGKDEIAQLSATINTMLDALESSERSREDLVHAMVHDLRNPLTTILMSLGLLGRPETGTLTAAQQQVLDAAQRGAQRTLELVNGILDVNRLEGGELALQRETVDVPALIAEVVHAQTPLAQNKRLTLDSNAATDLPPAQLDRALIRRVLENVLGNAIKFTPSGGAVRVETRVPEAGFLLIAVRDTGPGIPADVQARLFEKFAAGSQPERGSGLGLAFCRLAVEAHGGRIWAESAPGQGTVISFVLPC
jgi:signal transduction histidine kinase